MVPVHTTIRPAITAVTTSTTTHKLRVLVDCYVYERGSKDLHLACRCVPRKPDGGGQVVNLWLNRDSAYIYPLRFKRYLRYMRYLFRNHPSLLHRTYRALLARVIRVFKRVLNKKHPLPMRWDYGDAGWNVLLHYIKKNTFCKLL